MNARMSALVAPILLIAGPSGSASAAGTVQPGDRVRLMAPSAYTRLEGGELLPLRIEGQIRELDDDRWVVTERNGIDREIPVNAITRLEVARSTGSRAGKGAAVGALVGLGVGLAVGAAAASAEGNSQSIVQIDPGAIIAATGGIGLLAGAGLGAAIGASMKTETWHTVPLDQLGAERRSIGPPRLAVVVSAKF